MIKTRSGAFAGSNFKLTVSSAVDNAEGVSPLKTFEGVRAFGSSSYSIECTLQSQIVATRWKRMS